MGGGGDGDEESDRGSGSDGDAAYSSLEVPAGVSGLQGVLYLHGLFPDAFLVGHGGKCSPRHWVPF
jgi:hypothetical protein